MTGRRENKRGTKIQITPEMVEAGVEAMAMFHPHDPQEAIVLAILKAAILQVHNRQSRQSNGKPPTR